MENIRSGWQLQDRTDKLNFSTVRKEVINERKKKTVDLFSDQANITRKRKNKLFSDQAQWHDSMKQS